MDVLLQKLVFSALRRFFVSLVGVRLVAGQYCNRNRNHSHHRFDHKCHPTVFLPTGKTIYSWSRVSDGRPRVSILEVKFGSSIRASLC